MRPMKLRSRSHLLVLTLGMLLMRLIDVACAAKARRRDPSRPPA